MTTVFPSAPTAFAEGEVLVFTSDAVTAETVRALCGVSGNARADVTPRLVVCGTDSASVTSAKATCIEDVPVLFLTEAESTPPWTPKRFSLLPLPLRFSDFRQTAARLCADVPLSPKEAPSPQPRTIRIEHGTAISEGVRVPLTPCEEKLLTALIEAYPHAAKKERLEEAFTRHSGNSVRVYVTYLRKKLASLPAYRAILAEKDGGFSLVLHGEA